jgi:ferritin
MKPSSSFFKIPTLVFLAALSIPALPQQQDVNAEKDETSTTAHTKTQTTRWSSSTGVSEFNIEVRGKIELTDDDKDIKSMSNDGYLEINKTVFGSKRSIVIESLGGGKIQKEYYEGRTKKDWEPDGKAWLGEILPEIVSNSTIGAESRVNRFFKAGGVAAVLNEIKKMESNHAQAHYATLLMKQPVQVQEYASIVNTVSQAIESDHYITQFLKSYVEKFMQDKAATTAIFNATHKIESDHYKTILIKEALRGQTAALENVRIILKAVSEMESDHYITEVLTSLLRQTNLSDAVIAELIVTTNAIESDHHKNVVLTRVFERPGLSSNSYQKAIESASNIESDHYLTETFKHLLNNKMSDENQAAMLTALASVESDHYQADILKTFLSKQDLSDQQFGKAVERCTHMESDHYATVVLQQALRLPGISDAKVISVLGATKKMDSDHYITTVLVEASSKVKTASQPVKEAFRDAARNINSETYYGKALKSIEQ